MSLNVCLNILNTYAHYIGILPYKVTQRHIVDNQEMNQNLDSDVGSYTRIISTLNMEIE